MKLRLVVLILAILFCNNQLFATSIQKLTFDERMEMAELIFEGEVVSVAQFQSGQLIFSRVTFTVEDVLKGTDPGDTVELVFLGGEYGGRKLKISGQDVPGKGERGIYFVKDVTGKAINPLAGWSQGRFRILTDAKGRESFDGRDSHSVMEITGYKDSILAAKMRNMRFSRAQVEEKTGVPATPDELRRAIRDYMAGE